MRTDTHGENTAPDPGKDQVQLIRQYLEAAYGNSENLQGETAGPRIYHHVGPDSWIIIPFFWTSLTTSFDAWHRKERSVTYFCVGVYGGFSFVFRATKPGDDT